MPSIETTDWHVHYFRDGCADAEMTVDAILEATVGRGIEEIGILGHFRNRIVIHDLAYWTEPNPKFFEFLRADIVSAREHLPGGRPSVYIGAEADINTIEGELSISETEASVIDYVMIGMHWPPTLPPLIDYVDLEDPAAAVEAYCSYNHITPEEFSMHRLITDIFDSMTNAVVRNEFVDILAHPAAFATKLGSFCVGMDTHPLFAGLAQSLASNGVAYELNTSVFKEYDPEVTEVFVKPLIRECIDAGVSFVLGSDAHRLDEVGDLEAAMEMKRALDIPDRLIVTSLEKLPGKRKRA